MSGTPKFKHRLEYRLVRALGWFLNLFPYRCALAFALVIGRVVYALSVGRRREALRRVKLVFGDSLTDREARGVCWISFRNTLFSAVEMMRISDFTLDDLRVMLPELNECIKHLENCIKKAGGRGVVLALPHMGNWDLAGSACAISGLPIFSVAAKQRNELMNGLMNKWRSGHGMDIIERGGGTLRQILERIKDGQVFAILPDTRSFTPDLLVPFLGGEANLARGMAWFAYAAEVPVVPLVMRRIGWTRFKITFHDPVWPDHTGGKEGKSDELRRITKKTIGIIDAAIHETPEQWFWYNKRWVLDPVDSKRG